MPPATTTTTTATKTRAWCFTLNNWTTEEYNTIVSCACRYMVVGKEVATTGTQHLQGYVYFKNARTLDQVKQKLNCDRLHLEKARGNPEQNLLYCSKDGDYVELGEKPKSSKEKGEMEVQRWNTARTLAKLGNFDDIDGDIFIRCMKNLESIHRQEKLKAQLQDNSAMTNEWIWGPTGCGKSSSVRSRYEESNLYNKPLNKWWDDYSGEPIVLLEDVDPTHEKWIGYFLKIWSDHYKFRGEFKGGSMMIRPKTIIVTSQYAIDQIFNDQETILALQRRFEQVKMVQGGTIVRPAAAPQ